MKFSVLPADFILVLNHKPNMSQPITAGCMSHVVLNRQFPGDWILRAISYELEVDII